jgi:glycine/D-amino acid oxidase-like deaminating enzyme
MKIISSAWPASLWKTTAEPLVNMNELPGDIDTDVLIIGAGYTGLSCALHSIDSIKHIVVIDQVQPGWGCSGRNGGQVNPQWKPTLANLRQLYPNGEFNRFVKALDKSASLVFDLIEKYQIECQVRRCGSIIATRGEKGIKYLADWSKFWKAFGADVELLNSDTTRKTIGTNAYDCCMLDRRGGSLQPLSYARGLARACLQQGVTIFGDTRALKIIPNNNAWTVQTSKGSINCERVILGTNGYTDDLWPGLAQSLIPVASMLTATRPLPTKLTNTILPDRQPVAEYAGVPAYYRIDESNRLVFGWRGTLSGGIGSLDTKHLRSKALRLFPSLKGVDWEYDWAGYVGITSHQRPMLIELADNVYAGLGYNGRGITMATMMGKQLSLLLKHQETEVAVRELERVNMHRFYPVGVTARIVAGHVRDSLTKSIPDIKN